MLHKTQVGKHVTHVITDLGDGGAQRSLFTLCQNESRCSHAVISLRGMGKYGGELTDIGVPVLCLDLPRGRVTLRSLWRLTKLLSDKRIDAVQCWMYHANLLGSLAAVLARPKRINWGIRHTDLKPQQTPRGTRLVAKLGAYLSHSSPSAIICCAEAARKVHVGYGYTKRKMIVIPNGYDLERLKPDQSSGERFRKKHMLNGEVPLIGFAARLNPQKDHHNLLYALKSLRKKGVDVYCVLAGTGLEADSSPLIDLIDKLGLGGVVKLLGPVDDIPAFMNALDVHVMSSSFGEAFPNVLAEAMACGTPCVTTDVGDASLIVGETGRVVSPQDPAKLAEGIKSLLEVHATPKWGQVQQGARQQIEESFSIEMFCQKHYEAWFPKER